ncbi:MAG: DUF3800 domain-containing protein [Desulfurococcales archaeon]|nr:DUF3800 domain-containing protein [Desulfurococcales archaeon]
MELWIAIDESGDLGFSDRSSRYLVLSFIFTTEACLARRYMKKLLKRFVRKKQWPIRLGELKFTLSKTKLRHQGINESKYIEKLDDTRVSVLDSIKSLRVNAAVSIVDKKLAHHHLRMEPNNLYNYALTHPLITHFIPRYNPPPNSKINIIIDKRLGSRALENLKIYIKSKYSYMRDYEKRIGYKVYFNVNHVSSHNEPLIWIADYIAGSVNYYLVTGKEKYLNVIKDVFFDCIYFWNNPLVCNKIIRT